MVIIIIVTLFLVLLTRGLRDPRIVVYAAIFLAPWQGLDLDIGLRITGYRLAVLALFATAIILSIVKSKKHIMPIKPNPWVWALIFYAVSYSTIQAFWLPTTGLGSGEMRTGEMRSFSQIFMFIITISPILIIPYFIQKKEDILTCSKVYLWSITILAALGFIQLTVWYWTGTNPFPIGLVDSMLSSTSSESVRSAIDYVGSNYVYRMNSFGGEPKGLATGIAVALLILQAGYSSEHIQRNKHWKIYALWIFLMLSLVLTWSTSGAFLWIIGTLTITLTGLIDITKKHGKKNILIGFFLLLSVAGGTYTYVSSDESPSNAFSSVATNRFIERNPIEDFDETVIAFLSDQPEHLLLGVGLGNVHQYAAPYIPSYAVYYMKDNIFVAKSGYLRILSELGLIGLTMFIFSIWWWLSKIRNELKYQKLIKTPKNITIIIFTLGTTLFIGGMARTYIWPQMFLMLGICSAYLTILQEQRKKLS